MIVSRGPECSMLDGSMVFKGKVEKEVLWVVLAISY